MIIDVHHHWMPGELYYNVEKYLRPGQEVVQEGQRYHVVKGGVTLFSRNPKYTLVEEQLVDMDAAGIDMAVLHLSTWQAWTTVRTSPFINDGMAELVGRYPRRFIGLAHVPPDKKAGLKELERAVRGLGLKGVGITTHLWGKPLDHPSFWPFYEKVAELNVPIVVHPAPGPAEDRFLRDYRLTRTLGRAIDLLTATVRLLHSGLLQRFPNLRFIVAHLGGAIFALRHRVHPRHQFSFDRPPEEVDRFDDGLGRIYVDTAPPYWTSAEVRFATEMLGPEQVLFGSDYPVNVGGQDNLSRARAIVEGLPDGAIKARVLGENAARLFGVP